MKREAQIKNEKRTLKQQQHLHASLVSSHGKTAAQQRKTEPQGHALSQGHADSTDISSPRTNAHGGAFYPLSGVLEFLKGFTNSATKVSDKGKNVRRKYVASLDGLRAFGVIAVMAYHLNLWFAQGGLIGVAIFFVLSGYLITGILVHELESYQKIRLGRFWLHRVRRLFPAIAVVVVLTTVLCVFFNHNLLAKLKPDIIPSLFWFQNWWYIVRDLSYFQSIGDPSPVIHFWSLAIEEQFYVIWPLLLLGLYKAGLRKKGIRRTCLVLAVISVILMAVIYDPSADPTRVYYGTDTRAFSLLIGGWLALVWPWKRFNNTAALDAEHTRALDIASGVSFVALLWICVCVQGSAPAMFYGLLALVSLLTAIMIAAAVIPGTQTAKILAWKPLSWIGLRSYGMYLWHYPIILLLKPLGMTPGKSYTWWFVIVVFALTFAVAALQYKYIEDPIRKGLLGKIYHEWRHRRARGITTQLSVKGKAIVTVCAAAVAISLVGIIVIPNNDMPDSAIQSTGVAADAAKTMPQGQGDKDTSSADGENSPNSSDANQKLSGAVAPDGTSIPSYVQGDAEPLLIGDSVPSALDLSQVWPNSNNDSYVGRSTEQAIQVLQGYLDQGVVGHDVIVASFSNHPLQPGELDQIVDMSDDREIFFVNVRTPDPDTLANNQIIDECAAQHDNVHVVDWYGASANHGDYFWNDGIHMTPDGMQAYTNLLVSSVNPYLPPEDATS